ncbi:MAG: hypothetical protein QG559_1274 [Campylobacterota bacterium]|nr:hypothetical protein [Campylobacterota bacterium]
MFKKYILLFSFLWTFLFNGCSGDKKEESVNDMVATAEYVLRGIDNKEYVVKKQGGGFVLSDAKDKIVIFDIFATWCPPCRTTASHLTSLQQKYKDNLIIIGLTIEDGIENSKLQEFANTYNAKYAIANSDQNRRLINDIATGLQVGPKYPIPLMAMYKDAKLINYYAGATQEEFIESDIKNALGNK